MSQRVPARPERLIQPIQGRAVDEGLLQQKAVGSQAVEGRSLHPGVAVGPDVSHVQPIDDQADRVHGVILATRGEGAKGERQRAVLVRFGRLVVE